MQNYHMTVLERLKVINRSFQTEPFEVGWAREALFYVETRGSGDASASIESRIQISQNGITWVDEGSVLSWPGGDGIAFARVREFGGWLRLDTRVTLAPAQTARATLSLCLKG